MSLEKNKKFTFGVAQHQVGSVTVEAKDLDSAEEIAGEIILDGDFVFDDCETDWFPLLD
jgi:hypothetical protein|tara:strand:- start:566 stop:742 length:177 start_codon:yes stop_codon:yes gene_type:complete